MVYGLTFTSKMIDTGNKESKRMPEQSEQLPAYEERYGNIAVKNGYITPEQLAEALKVQVMEEMSDRNHRHIGLILFDLKYITLTQDREVLGVLMKD